MSIFMNNRIRDLPNISLPAKIDYYRIIISCGNTIVLSVVIPAWPTGCVKNVNFNPFVLNITENPPPGCRIGELSDKSCTYSSVVTRN